MYLQRNLESRSDLRILSPSQTVTLFNPLQTQFLLLSTEHIQDVTEYYYCY